jgi:ATP-dependent RNA helicase DDX27
VELGDDGETEQSQEELEEDRDTGSAEEGDPLGTSDEEDVDELPEPYDSESDAASSSSDDTEPETQAEKDRKAAFFADDSSPTASHSSFLSMNLSRPIMKALTSLAFHAPTPIQAATIPVALLGKDVVGGAVTGSGKTAAFVIPMLERLMYRERGKNAAATRCLVLVPTRELAVQCFEVGTKLAAHTDVQFCLIVGAFDSIARYHSRSNY